jgi:hypothetical protein
MITRRYRDIEMLDIGALAESPFSFPYLVDNRTFEFRLPMKEEEARRLAGLFERVTQLQLLMASGDTGPNRATLSAYAARLCVVPEEAPEVPGACSPWLIAKDAAIDPYGEAAAVLSSDWASPRCREYTTCRVLGLCAAVQGECRAVSDEDCNQGGGSPCLANKRCRALEGRCVADSTENAD